MAVLNSVDKFYRTIIEVVLLECRELFLDDGVDESVLTDLKQMWERKVKQAKVFEFTNLKHTNSSFNIGSYGIISSSRNIACPEILVPSIHLRGPRGDGLNSCTPTATIALPYGLYQQQISALNSAGISLQPSGNGQFLAFLRPDQQRPQSLTLQQNRPVSGKGHPIIVSTPPVAPVRPENMAQSNRVSTSSVQTKAIPELKKQTNLPSQGVVKNGPTEIIYPQTPLNNNNNNNNNASGSSVTNANNNLDGSNIPVNYNPNPNPNPKFTKNANFNINTSNTTKDNSVPSNIKAIPNDSISTTTTTTTNYSCIDDVKDLKSFTNTSSTLNSNPVRNNDCIVGTNQPPVSTNPSVDTFNSLQNTHLSLSTSSTDTNPSYSTQMYNNGAYYNPPLRTLPNNFEDQRDNNSYALNPGLYNNSLYPTAQTGGSFSVPNTPESLDDYMDNLSDSNSASYSSVNPQPNTINADRNIISDFDSAVNTISNLIRDHSTSSSRFNNNNNNPHLLSGPPSTIDYKRAPSDGELVPGHTSRFSEEDMQTIQEILQLDGTGDEYEFKSAPKMTLLQHETLRSFSPKRRSGEKKVTTCKINNPKIPKTKSEQCYQNNSKCRKPRNFNDQNYFLEELSPFQRLKMRKILNKHSPRRDYVLNKTNHSTGDNLMLSIGTDTPVSDPNSTLDDDQEYDLKTEIPKCGYSSKNKKPPFCVYSVSKPAPMLTLNRFEKLPTFTKEKRSGIITIRSLSPDSNSSVSCIPPPPHQSIQIIKDIPTINSRYSKPGMISKRTEVETCRESGYFLRVCVPHQFDGEDAGSSSSSDDNTNANDAPSDEEGDDDDEDECEESNNEEVEDVAIESEPLNSADDDSDIDICAMFESENIVVCQFEKISRNKNKWKFHLKDGIMNLYGRDLIFSKSVGEAEW